MGEWRREMEVQMEEKVGGFQEGRKVEMVAGIVQCA